MIYAIKFRERIRAVMEGSGQVMSDNELSYDQQRKIEEQRRRARRCLENIRTLMVDGWDPHDGEGNIIAQILDVCDRGLADEPICDDDQNS